jgi:hypothetical protein
MTNFSGPSAMGTGTITASLTGGGPGCTFVNPRFIGAPPTESISPAPSGVVFPHGLFDFRATGCAPGSTITLTITYPRSIAGADYWKYGPTASDAAPHWYILPAMISGNTATFTITDGGLGDDDLAANGAVVDQGGPAIPGPAAAAQVPTLSEWMLALLALAMMGLAMRHESARRS